MSASPRYITNPEQRALNIRENTRQAEVDERARRESKVPLGANIPHGSKDQEIETILRLLANIRGMVLNLRRQPE